MHSRICCFTLRSFIGDNFMSLKSMLSFWKFIYANLRSTYFFKVYVIWLDFTLRFMIFFWIICIIWDSFVVIWYNDGLFINPSRATSLFLYTWKHRKTKITADPMRVQKPVKHLRWSFYDNDLRFADSDVCPQWLGLTPRPGYFNKQLVSASMPVVLDWK